MTSYFQAIRGTWNSVFFQSNKNSLYLKPLVFVLNYEYNTTYFAKKDIPESQLVQYMRCNCEDKMSTVYCLKNTMFQEDEKVSYYVGRRDLSLT